MAFLSQVGGNIYKGGSDPAMEAFTRALSGNVSDRDSNTPSLSTLAEINEATDVSEELAKRIKENNPTYQPKNDMELFGEALSLGATNDSDSKKESDEDDTSTESTEPSDPSPNKEQLPPVEGAQSNGLINEISEVVMSSGDDTKKMKDALGNIADRYVNNAINVNSIINTWQQLNGLGLGKDQGALKGALAATNAYRTTVGNATGKNVSQLSAPPNLDQQKRNLAELGKKLMNTQYQLIKVTQQIDENLSRASKVKKMLETAPEMDRAALNLALAQYVKSVNQYQPSWYLLDNLTRTLRHQMYTATEAARLPTDEWAEYKDTPWKNNDEVLESLNNRYGAEHMAALAQGIMALNNTSTIELPAPSPTLSNGAVPLVSSVTYN
jgi:hypothetical protein